MGPGGGQRWKSAQSVRGPPLYYVPHEEARKQEVMVYLKQLMQNGQVHIPYDRELISELNVEQYEMMKTGQIRFDHPTGTHDDRLWAFALAVYASRPEVPEHLGVVLRGRSRRLDISFKERLSRQMWRGQKATEGSIRMCIACGTKRPLDKETCPNCQKAPTKSPSNS